MSNIPEIEVSEAKNRIEAGSVLVDVREQNEYDQERIAGSILIPLSEFEERFEVVHVVDKQRSSSMHRVTML